MNYFYGNHGRPSNLDAVLAAYAAGAVSVPVHVMVASHLALSPRSRSFVAAMETLAASELAGGPENSAPEDKVRNRDQRLADIFADLDAPVATPLLSDGVIPAPLASFLGGGLDTLAWRSVLPGLREAKVSAEDGMEVSLLWIRAGRAMPAHTHAGTEATLVLKGAFSDAHGYYERGDMAVVDSDVDHRPVAGDAEDCICFVVAEGPVKLTGPVARLFARLFGH